MQSRFMMIIKQCNVGVGEGLCVNYCQVCEQQHICVQCPGPASPLLMMGLYLLWQYLSQSTTAHLTPLNSSSNFLISYMEALDLDSQKGYHL